MQTSWYYIKDSEDFIEKIKKTSNTPDGANLVTADVVGLYLSIPHELGLKALEEAPPPPPPKKKKKKKRDSTQISTPDLVKMAKFVLQDSYFEFNGETKQ